MRVILRLVFLCLLVIPALAQAQRDSSRMDFASAESWMQFEEYAEAAALYQKLLQWYPDNHNLKYKIGICLLNDPYRKQESIAYLEEASEHINNRYKDGSFKETASPPDVLFYLGNAYLVNVKLFQAKNSYKRFLEIMDPVVYDVELVKAQIRACDNARKLMASPVDMDIRPAPQDVNTASAQTHPVLSGDGKRMAYITEQPFFDEALFIEKLEDGNWSLPQSLTAMLGFDQDVYPVALNYDGTEMLLYYDDERIGNLYLSTYADGIWQPAEKLGEHISTKFWESHASFSRDGRQLYFTSNRKGGLGGLDIYLSEKTDNGKWGPPRNLGSRINTRYNEESPFITEDGNTLFFSSYGHYNMGGYDVFRSTREAGGTWSEPVNLGYPVNSTGDDVFFLPVHNGRAGYQARLEKNSRGRYDLYYMDIYSPSNPRIYRVSGTVRTGDGSGDPGSIQLALVDPASGDTLRKRIPVDADGSFRLELPRGDYQFHASAEGYITAIVPLGIHSHSEKTGITLPGTIELKVLPPTPMLAESKDSLRQDEDSTQIDGDQIRADSQSDSGEAAELLSQLDDGGDSDDSDDSKGLDDKENTEDGPVDPASESTVDQTNLAEDQAKHRKSGDAELVTSGRPLLIPVIAGGGILLLLFLWFRRKKKSK